MASPELLPHAPITEAILDVRVSARRDFQVQDFLALAGPLKDHFPQCEERRGFQFTSEIEVGGHGEARTTDLGIQGYFFKSADGLDVAQFRIDGFTLNRLRPYRSWDVWFPLFVRTWERYVAVARPDRATRIAARCINHVPLPTHGVPAEYLSNPPRVPADLPDMMASFVTSVALWHSDDPALGVNLTQALERVEPGNQRLVIDVDAFRTGDFGTNDLVERFEELHQLRDQAFFESITNAAKDLFR